MVLNFGGKFAPRWQASTSRVPDLMSKGKVVNLKYVVDYVHKLGNFPLEVSQVENDLGVMASRNVKPYAMRQKWFLKKTLHW